jgi:hypothetical protein
MGNLCQFLGGYIGGTYGLSEGIAKETEGEHKGNIEARLTGELANWRIGEYSMERRMDFRSIIPA